MVVILLLYQTKRYFVIPAKSKYPKNSMIILFSRRMSEVASTGYVTHTLAANLLSEMKSSAREKRTQVDIFAELTERERQILELIADGISNKEIGQKIFLTEKTIKHYVTNILQKLHVSNRVQATILAQKKKQEK